MSSNDKKYTTSKGNSLTSDEKNKKTDDNIKCVDDNWNLISQAKYELMNGLIIETTSFNDILRKGHLIPVIDKNSNKLNIQETVIRTKDFINQKEKELDEEHYPYVRQCAKIIKEFIHDMHQFKISNDWENYEVGFISNAFRRFHDMKWYHEKWRDDLYRVNRRIHKEFGIDFTNLTLKTLKQLCIDAKTCGEEFFKESAVFIASIEIFEHSRNPDNIQKLDSDSEGYVLFLIDLNKQFPGEFRSKQSRMREMPTDKFILFLITSARDASRARSEIIESYHQLTGDTTSDLLLYYQLQESFKVVQKNGSDYFIGLPDHSKLKEFDDFMKSSLQVNDHDYEMLLYNNFACQDIWKGKGYCLKKTYEAVRKLKYERERSVKNTIHTKGKEFKENKESYQKLCHDIIMEEVSKYHDEYQHLPLNDISPDKKGDTLEEFALRKFGIYLSDFALPRKDCIID